MYRRQRCPTRRTQLGFILIGRNRALLGGSFNVLDLFKASEQGYWYDSSDLASMYQESTGVTPAYAPGQGSADCPIGFRVDKRSGLARGAELWADGSVTLTGASTKVSAGVYRVYSAAGTASAVNVPASLVSGLWYEVTLTVDSVTTAGTGIKLASTASTPTWTTTGAKRAIMLANATSASITINSGVATEYQVSGVSFKLLAGNHATQSVSGSRPTLSARYNLVLASENLGAASWTKTRCSIIGTAQVQEDSTAAATHEVDTTGIIMVAGLSYKFSAEVKPNGRTIIGVSNTANGVQRGEFTLVGAGSASVNGVYTPGVNASVNGLSISLLGDGYYSISATILSTSTTNLGLYMQAVAGALNYSGDGASGVFIRKVDLRLTDDATKAIPAYQRVDTATTYDTAGFPWYLKCDGFDDGMVTNTIDFTATDKLCVWAGVTKLSDAAIGAVMELSATLASNNGTVNLLAPNTAAANFGFSSKGTIASTQASSGYAAPLSSVLGGCADIVGDSCTLRVNGVAAVSSTDQGTGNFGNYPVYLFRRGGASLPAAIRDYGQIARGAASTAAQLANTDRFLARNMGITI